MLEFFTREIFIERTRGSTLPEDRGSLVGSQKHQRNNLDEDFVGQK